jgi:hypothetical protein
MVGMQPAVVRVMQAAYGAERFERRLQVARDILQAEQNLATTQSA